MSDTVSKLYGNSCLQGFLVGCEFELESIHDVVWSSATASQRFASITEDNSLRNNGREFVTKPLSVENALKAHSSLFDGLNVFYGNKDEACTDRCSTHIHVNFSDVSVDKTLQFIRLYALVEPLFFQAVNEDRQNNIYCVPLSSTHLLKMIINADLPYMVDHWHKYAAFNIKRLADLGTIEFRHFEATPDTSKLAEWLRMIKALYDFNMTTDVDIMINDVVMYKLVSVVAGKPYSREAIYQMCEDTLINDLLITINPTKDLINQRIKTSKETV